MDIPAMEIDFGGSATHGEYYTHPQRKLATCMTGLICA